MKIDTTIMLIIKAISAIFSVASLLKIPNRNVPSIPPKVNDAILNANSTTALFVFIKKKAEPINITDQKIVNILE